MKKLYIEYANTPLKREQGLMGRKKMSRNNGMLFGFPNSRRLSFWMHNTYLPLEIAFIDEKGIITEIKEMIPLSTRPITSSNHCKYALEVNKGWFDNNNITVGSSVAGTGIDFKKYKTAQMTPQSPTQAPAEEFPVEPGLGDPTPPLEAPQQDSLNPDIVLNKSHKETLEEAELKGQDLIVMYITKEGNVLPPKSISPPFVFESNADGEANSIVKAWDNQDGSWKSFLIDNIIDLQLQEIPEENQEKAI